MPSRRTEGGIPDSPSKIALPPQLFGRRLPYSVVATLDFSLGFVGRSLSGLTIATLKSQSMAASPSPPMLAAFIVQESNKSIASSRICSPKLHSRNHQENNLQTNPNRTQELPVNSGQSLVDELENQGENKKQEPQKPKNTPSEKFAPPCGFKNQEPQKVAPGWRQLIAEEVERRWRHCPRRRSCGDRPPSPAGLHASAPWPPRMPPPLASHRRDTSATCHRRWGASSVQALRGWRSERRG